VRAYVDPVARAKRPALAGGEKAFEGCLTVSGDGHCGGLARFDLKL
jgi:hypothetical protein